jgi:hypothetical protein
MGRYKTKFTDEELEEENNSRKKSGPIGFFGFIGAILFHFILDLYRLCKFAASKNPSSPITNLIIDSFCLASTLVLMGFLHFWIGVISIGGLLGFCTILGFMRRHYRRENPVPELQTWLAFGERLKVAYSAKFGDKNQAFNDEVDLHIRAMQAFSKGSTKRIDKDWLKRMAKFVDVNWSIPLEDSLSDVEKTEKFETPTVKFDEESAPKMKREKKHKKEQAVSDGMPNFDTMDNETIRRWIAKNPELVSIKFNGGE